MSLTSALAWLALLLAPVAAGAVLYRRRPAARPGVRAVLGTALLYALLGPPLGALVVAIPALLGADDPEPGLMLAFFVLMSYPFGGLPALVGGGCVALLRPLLGALGRLLAAALCCGLTSVLFGLGVSGLRPEGLAMMGALGAGCGVALEAAWLGWQRHRARGRSDRSTGAGKGSSGA